MPDPVFTLIVAAATLAAIMTLSAAALRGWTGWLDLKHAELAHGQREPEAKAPSAATRIEVADLKERIRKLEAIAAGVDI